MVNLNNVEKRLPSGSCTDKHGRVQIVAWIDKKYINKLNELKLSKTDFIRSAFTETFPDL